MKTIAKILLTAVAVMILEYILPGVDVPNFWVAIIVAVVLGLLQLIVKPILVILTLPITILTLGLFLLVINACIILIGASIVDDFTVNSFWWALIFSLLLSFLQSLLYSAIEKDKP